MNIYTLRSNLGSKEEPFWVSKEVGTFVNHRKALELVDSVLSNCDKVLTWFLFENEEILDFTFKSEKNPKQGLSYSITIDSDTVESSLECLESIKSIMSMGSTLAYTESYTLNCSGNEYIPLEFVTFYISHMYVAFDSEKILLGSESYEEIQKMYKNKENEIFFGENASFSDMNKNKNKDDIYFIFDEDKNFVISGNFEFIMNFFEDDSGNFYSYRKI